MTQVLLASHNGQLYKRRVRSVADIADLIRETDLETLTSGDGQIDFWFTPSTHPSHRRVNRNATQIFLATTGFTASTVPLLRGIIVVTAHDPAGELQSLTDTQVQHLAETLDSTSWWQNIVLSRRYTRDHRGQRRQSRAAQKRHLAAAPWG